MLTVFANLTDEAQEAFHEIIQDLDARYTKTRDTILGEIAYVAGERINSGNQIIFSLNGKLYCLNGYYDSNEGTTWDELDSVYEVVARETTITVYDQV